MTATLSVRRYDVDDPRCEAPLTPDVAVVDPHHHLLCRDWISYRATDLATDLAAGHRVEASVYVECSSAYRETGPTHLRPVGETEHVVAEAAQPGLPAGTLAGIVAYADLELGEAVAEVLDAQLAAADGRLRGIRYSTAWHPDLANGPRVAGMLADPRVHAGLSVLSRYELPLDCWLYPHQFDELVEVARLFPEQTFVVDHLGSPLAGVADSGGRAAALASWRTGIARLAAHPNIIMKVGGLTGPMLGAPWPVMSGPSSVQIVEFWRPIVEIAIEAFGPVRCLFESNFPIDGMVVDYVTLWNAHKRLAEPYSVAERGRMLSESAISVYRLHRQVDDQEFPMFRS
jgi:L-fuconolactonase